MLCFIFLFLFFYYSHHYPFIREGKKGRGKEAKKQKKKDGEQPHSPSSNADEEFDLSTEVVNFAMTLLLLHFYSIISSFEFLKY